MSVKIGIDELQVGMFVHLDLGWMSHPFPLSSFRIASAEQISIIRTLGLTELRWSPEKSELPAAAGVLATAGPVAAGPAAPRPDEPQAALPQSAPPQPAEPVPSLEARAASARREVLAAERAATLLAERQYGEATQAYKGIVDKVVQEPGVAREQAEALTRALLDKMLGDQELAIRTVAHGGEHAAAHALNVTVVSLLMGRAFGLDEQEMMDLGVGSMLHDVGKLELPDRLRFPEDGMTTVEQSVYREHVAHGVRHGKRMGLTPGALLVIAQHHEQADGSGFPQKLQIERLSGPARMVALVNRYDNLCNPLLPARAVTPHEALSMLFAQGRQKYDSTMLAQFIRMMGIYPPGSLVQLTDDRYAMVMSVNSSRPLKPRVLVHDPKVPRDEALLLDLETCSDLGVRRSLKASQVPAVSLDYLSPPRRVTYFFEPVRPVPLAEPAEEAAA
jgi:HD-GYP domain-containing protein (c-di-GMP phosphodiesterase class II)